MKLQTYQQILEHLKKEKREKHLLMGNGFSIAYDPKIFSYNALSDFIKKSDNSLLIKLFEIVNTYNFEQIMQQLNMSKKIISVFDSKSQGLQEIDKSIELLKEALISAVKALHPEYVFSIPEEKSTACARFLSDYLGTNESIFTTNYDILLYWVLMRNEIPNCIDGFGRDLENDDGEYIPEEEREYSELRWGKHKDIQNIFYLHGALPIFDAGIDIIKEEYDGKYILDKIKMRMEKGNYPIFVTAGNGDEKLNHILHNHYLSFCYDKLSTIKGSLVTFGFNFGEYDEHIIRAINLAAKQDIRNCLRSVYIGVYSDDDKKHIEQIEHKFKCKVNIFDTKTANIWN